MNLLKAAAEKVLTAELQTIGKAWLAMEATVQDLQLQVQRKGWQQIAGGGLGPSTFTRADIGTVVDLCRAAALKNPLIIRGLAVRQDYVFGQGLTITSESEAEEKLLKAFLENRRNQNQLTGHQGYRYAQLEMDTTGNLFVACIGANDAGTPVSPPQVRSLPIEQIKAVIPNPDDSEDIWFYRRERIVTAFDPSKMDAQGAQRTVCEYHPSLSYWRDVRRAGGRSLKVPLIGGKPVRWDAPIAHRRRGGFNHWQWGMPLLYPAIDWAEAHTRYLSNWDNFVSALAQVAVRMTGKGVTQDQLNAVKAAMQSGLAAGQSTETNPPPVSASVLAINDKWKYEAFKASGMAPEVGDAKGFRLQIASVFGFPDTFFGDTDQGNWATARTLDRPTELAIKSEQEEWANFLEDLCNWALEVSGAGNRSIKQREAGVVKVSFPPIVQHNPQEIVEALAKAISSPIGSDLRGAEEQVRKALLTAAGVSQQDLEAVLDNAEFDPDPGIQDDPNEPPADPDRDAQEARYAQLVRKIVEAARAA